MRSSSSAVARLLWLAADLTLGISILASASLLRSDDTVCGWGGAWYYLTCVAVGWRFAYVSCSEE